MLIRRNKVGTQTKYWDLNHTWICKDRRWRVSSLTTLARTIEEFRCWSSNTCRDRLANSEGGDNWWRRHDVLWLVKWSHLLVTSWFKQSKNTTWTDCWLWHSQIRSIINYCLKWLLNKTLLANVKHNKILHLHLGMPRMPRSTMALQCAYWILLCMLLIYTFKFKVFIRGFSILKIQSSTWVPHIFNSVR